MKQSRAMSLLETTLSTAAGFGISLAAQATVLPMLGVTVSFGQNVAFAVVMTFVSIARQFAMRRLFEALHIRIPMSPFLLAVIAERRRQIEVEGWSAEHDDQSHGVRELARAGAAYLIGPESFTVIDYEDPDEPTMIIGGRLLWPWAVDWWKPQGFRRDLVRGCALAIAEGEKFDRARKRRRA